MSDRRTAPCRDLAMMVEVYPEDKRLRVQVPLSDFGRNVTVTPGEGVDVVGWTDGLGRPSPSAPRVEGVVKRLIVEVEVDLATLEQPPAEGQGTLA